MTGTAQQYGQALYELALEEGLSRQLWEQLKALEAAFGSEPDFLRLLASATSSKQSRLQLLDDCFREMIHPYLLHFLKLLTQERIIRGFPDCCKYFQDRYFADQGILPVQIYTARALTKAQLSRLAEKIEAITGKTVIPENRVDPECLGGVRICYGGKQIDGTVKSRLDGIERQLKNTVL